MTTDRNGARCEAWTGCRMDPGHDGPHYPQTGWHESGNREHVHCGVSGHTDPGEEDAAPCYTREQIDAAVNAGANMIGYSDEINLIVNCQLTLLERPDATLEDVILSNWQADEEDYEEAGVDPQPTDADGNYRDHTEAEAEAVDAALVARVKGWSDLG